MTSTELAEKSRALDKWAKRLEQIVTGKELPLLIHLGREGVAGSVESSL